MVSEDKAALKAELAAKIADREKQLRKEYLAAKIAEREKELVAHYNQGASLPKEAPEKQSSFFNKVADVIRSEGREGLMTAKDLSAGLADYLDIPNIAAMGLHATGLKETPEFYPSVAKKVEEGFDKVTGGKLKPRNEREEWKSAITRGLANLPLAIVTGGASVPATAAKAITKYAFASPKFIKKMASSTAKPHALTATNVGANVGATVGSKTYLDNFYDKEKPNKLDTLGMLGAGIAGAKLGGGATRQGLAAIKARKGAHSQKYQNMKELDIPMSVSDVTKTKFPYYVDLMLSKSFGASGQFEKHHKKQQETIARHLGQKKFNPLEGTSKEELPMHLAKEGAVGYKERFNKNMNALREKVHNLEAEAIQHKTPIDVTDLYGNLHKKGQHLEVPEAISAHQKQDQGLFAKKVKNYSKAYSDKMGNKFMPLGEHEQLRKMALEAKNKNLTPDTIDTYNAFRENREKFLKQLMGEKPHVRFERSNKLYSDYKKKKMGQKSQEEVHQHIESLPSDEQAFNMLHSKDPRYVESVMSGLPKEKRRDLTQAIIQQAGEHNGQFSIMKAHTHLTRKGNHALNASLRGMSLQEQQNFKKAMKVIGEHKQKYEALANKSGTAHHIHNWQQISHQLAALGTATSGNLMPLASSMTILALAKGGAHLWTNQKFVSAFDKFNNAKTHSEKVKELRNMGSNPAFRALAKEQAENQEKSAASD